MKFVGTSITRDCGKSGFTRRWPYPGSGRTAPFVYVIKRDEVENLDLARFLAAFGVYQKPSLLRQFRRKIFHVIDGYDHVDAPLFEIPEVRKFYAHVCDVWPSWVFTGSLHGPNLWVLVLCATPNLAVRRKGNQCIISVREADVRALMKAARHALTLLGLRAGLPSDAIGKRLHDLGRYFKI
jgi:hypothetical protein